MYSHCKLQNCKPYEQIYFYLLKLEIVHNKSGTVQKRINRTTIEFQKIPINRFGFGVNQSYMLV